ncbi:MAG: hypothetical protein NT030_00170 [Candidatus Saganbacteria bacterium]|nr:hypothetical protein [Candidatus Saganbacteria bacterium]
MIFPINLSLIVCGQTLKNNVAKGKAEAIHSTKKKGSLDEVKRIESEIDDITNKLRAEEYRKVVARLIDKYENADPMDLYSLFYEYKSERRTQAIANLKAMGIYEEVEKDRAKFLTEEILGESLDENISGELLRLIDATRFRNFGWLWQTTYDAMKERNEFDGSAEQIISGPEVTNNLPALNKLNNKDLAKIFEYIGQPDHYFISWVITDAGHRAAYNLNSAIQDKILTKAGLVNLPAKDILELAIEHSSEHFKKILIKDSSRVFSYLKDTLSDPDGKTRAEATYTVWMLSKVFDLSIPEDIIPLIIKNLTNGEETHFESGAIWAIKILGKLKLRAFPHLTEALNDPDQVVSEKAKIVLKNMIDTKNGEFEDLADRIKEYNKNFSIGFGWIPYAYIMSPFSGLSTRDRSVPAHPDDIAKGDIAEPISLKDNYSIAYTFKNFYIEGGYKIKPNLSLKNRLSVYMSGSAQTRFNGGNPTEEGDYEIPPVNRQPYGENAYTFVSVGKTISNDLTLELGSKAKGVRPAIDFGFSLIAIEHIYGWDRFGKIKIMAKEYDLYPGLHVGVSGNGLIYENDSLSWCLQLLDLSFTIGFNKDNPVMLFGLQFTLPFMANEIKF